MNHPSSHSLPAFFGRKDEPMSSRHQHYDPVREVRRMGLLAVALIVTLLALMALKRYTTEGRSHVERDDHQLRFVSRRF